MKGIIVHRVFLDGDQESHVLRSDADHYPETRLTPSQPGKRLPGRVIRTMQEL